MKKTEKNIPKKSIFETFNNNNGEVAGIKSRIIRRFKSFVLRGSIE